MIKRLMLAVVLLVGIFFASCSPKEVEYVYVKDISGNLSCITAGENYSNIKPMASSGRIIVNGVMQNTTIISEASKIIKNIPLPQYYSEYNGQPLNNNNVVYSIYISTYDYKTGEAKLCAEVSIPDYNNRSLEIYLAYQREYNTVRPNNEIYVYYASHDTFTLNELKTHPKWFFWEKDGYSYIGS